MPPKIKNERFNELGLEPVELSLRPVIGVVVPLDELDAVPAAAAGLAADGAAYAARIEGARERCVYAFGQSSAIGARHILGLAAAEHTAP